MRVDYLRELVATHFIRKYGDESSRCSQELPCKKSKRVTAINDCLMTMQMPPMKGRYITVVSVYAPTINAIQEEKMHFYETLKSVLSLSG